MSESGDADLDLTIFPQPIQGTLHVRDRHPLPGRGTISRDQDVCAIQSHDGIRPARDGPNLPTHQCLKHTPSVSVRHHNSDY